MLSVGQKYGFLRPVLLLTLLVHLELRGEEIPDRDNGREPPSGVLIGLKDKQALGFPRGYFWRIAWRLAAMWAAEKPVAKEAFWSVDVWFVLHPNGTISDISIPDAELDENTAKAIRAFLAVPRWELWPKALMAGRAEPIRLNVSFCTDAIKKPNIEGRVTPAPSHNPG